MIVLGTFIKRLFYIVLLILNCNFGVYEIQRYKFRDFFIRFILHACLKTAITLYNTVIIFTLDT